MDTTFFSENNIEFDELQHSEIKGAGVTGAAQVLNCPMSYIVTTNLFEAAGEIICAVTGGGARPAPEAVAKAAGTDSAAYIEPARAEELTGLGKFDISPLTLWKKHKLIWDRQLLDYPYIIFARGGETTSLRVDTRGFIRAGVMSADISGAATGEKTSAYGVLLRRGFIDRITDEALCEKVMSDTETSGYIGFDPTADSLHVGSLVPIMALAHLQKAGLRPIALVGGGTALVGDPSGKTELRKMLTRAQVDSNAKGIENQLSNYIDFSGGNAKLVNNADWLADLTYIDFLREVGVHFSVNRMIKAECFASRMEKGLSFIEFNYMLMQAYDFVHLAEELNCLVQMGGSDQWGNICAGKDLGHRVHGRTIFGREAKRCDHTVGVTFPLLKNAAGGKFGKTEGGNVWLDKNRTSIFDFFQFWRNADDTDVRRFLSLFTFIPMEDVRELSSHDPGPELNEAKEILAFAATSLAHGVDQAFAAAATAKELFGGYGAGFIEKIVALGLADKNKADEFKNTEKAKIPEIELRANALAGDGYPVSKALNELGLVSSNGEAKRMIRQNAVTVDGEKVSSPGTMLPAAPAGAEIGIRVGKKKHGIVKVI